MKAALGLLFGVAASAHAGGHHSDCLRARFAATAYAGKSFRQLLGNGLALHLDPLKDDWGWQAAISLEGSDDDWAYPVNPPLRLGNSEALGTGYGRSARQTLSYTHEIRFPLTNADYSRMFDLAYRALWPDQSKQQPEKATAAYLDALKTVRTGAVVLSPLDYNQDGPPEQIRWMKFSAVVIVPRGFQVDRGLDWTAGRCSTEARVRGTPKGRRGDPPPP
jgi:hypothetical protein